MTQLNDIGKRATAERFLRAIQREKISKSEAGANIGFTLVQVSYVNNEKYWDRLGNSGWDKILAWVNSGYTLKEYPKHYPEAVLKPVSVTPVISPAEEVPPPDLPVNNDDILEMDFKDIPKPTGGFDVVKIKSGVLHEFIKNNATKIITKEDKHYYYLPFWFLDTNKDQWELYHLGNLPEDLKEAIKGLRGE
jgi:hypothetical protein